MPRLQAAIPVLAVILGCSSYVYVPPDSFTYDGPRSDAVPYRTLTRADFQAVERPKKNIDAQTAITCHADTFYVVAMEVSDNPDSTRWQSSLEKARFRALMYPKASWWNPKRASPKDTSRLLEHEQLHFDIAELVVRQANARIRTIRATGPTPEIANTRAQELFDGESARLNQMLIDWNARYDLETKNGIDKDEQKRWIELVKKELAATAST